ncbi:transposase [Aetokthonos hydrillicola Thurmond2011]|uniref:Transposase n=1 Tax=Aetokthonos hydrillicola Thurmond2011 TaxID=2712845 RepID=A0AAP5MCS1_9CYAN|nr:transposase [Aetokthonos hydrillicola]MDR9894512.1 transposase [Aetokthonos hydrillicola Thurmond2011]MDR9898683.1 transposase [Aetokthonos hydrillicola Thurmond2011]
MWNEYNNLRHVRTLKGVVKLLLKIRRCQNTSCERYRIKYRPEKEGSWALPQQEFGLDVIALVGALRYQEHKSIPQIHQQLCNDGVEVSERSVIYLLERYDELVALWLGDQSRLKSIVKKQNRLILAIDGMQPDVGHEVLWVIRDCLSGEILLAKTLLSSTSEDLAALLLSVKNNLGVKIDGVISDGQQSIRKAVEAALPGIAHGLCHFHYLKEAAKVIYEADRHAKKELKKHVRGIREIERSVNDCDQTTSEVIRGYCLAVRGSLTSDGRPPLDASGLKLQERLSLIEDSLERLAKKGGLPKPLIKLKQIVAKGLEKTASLFTPISVAYNWIHQAAEILDNETGLNAIEVQQSFQTLLDSMSHAKNEAGTLEPGITHFLKITRSYWSGLFHCYDVEGLPRTNNDLEQVFGVLRHHQRRCTGRKVAPSSLVIRGTVQLASAIATALHSFSSEDLAQVCVQTWQQLRFDLRQHQLSRIEQLRFRRNPEAYLANLETLLV